MCKEASFVPINPFKIDRTPMTGAELRELVTQWADVRDSVGSSVWASVSYSVVDLVGASAGVSAGVSVWASVMDSVRDSVGDSVGVSVWASVRDSVWAYIGGLFPNITKWTDMEGSDPWRPLLTLWYAGYVPSYDGTTWRIHAGPKAEVLYEFTNVEKGIGNAQSLESS